MRPLTNFRPFGILVVLAISFAVAWANGGLGSAPDADCTVDDVIKEFGITLTTENVRIDDATTKRIDDDSRARAPGSVVTSAAVGVAASDDVTPVDGHRVVARALEKVPDQLISGPVDQAPRSARVVCAIEVYDADTGEFLFSARRLDARSE